MAKVSKEAIQILAKRVYEQVDKKKEVAIPTKVSKLIAELIRLRPARAMAYPPTYVSISPICS